MEDWKPAILGQFHRHLGSKLVSCLSAQELKHRNMVKGRYTVHNWQNTTSVCNHFFLSWWSKLFIVFFLDCSVCSMYIHFSLLTMHSQPLWLYFVYRVSSLDTDGRNSHKPHDRGRHCLSLYTASHPRAHYRQGYVTSKNVSRNKNR